MYKNRLLPLLLTSVLVCTSHCGESDPYASVAMQPEPGNTNGDNGDIPQLIKLRQTARLEGTYGGEIRIDGDSWKAVSSQEEISLSFNGKDLKNIRQIEFILEFHPLDAFDFSSAVFVPQDPLLTFGAGVEQLENGQLRIGAASVSSNVEGEQALGRFTIRTSATFNPLNSAHIEVTFLSLGPSSSDRENYQRQELTMGVVVNE